MSENNGTNSTEEKEKEICPFCSKDQELCKSNFHHTIRCIYCKSKIHSCCDDDCKEIAKKLDIPSETDLVEVIESPKTKQLEEIQRFKIDMGIDPEHDGICNQEICQVKWQMNVWKLAFLQYKNNDIKQRALDSTFRILMLKPDKFAQLVKSGVIDANITPKEFVNARNFGWELMQPEEAQTFQAILEASFRRVTEIVVSQNSKVNIKKKLSDETVKKVQEAQQKATEKTKKTPAPKVSKFIKLIQDHMNRFKMTEDQAKDYLAKMGMTEDTVK